MGDLYSDYVLLATVFFFHFTAYCPCDILTNWSLLNLEGQGKRNSAAHRQGTRSHQSCVESLRALQQRVPAGNRMALAIVRAVKPCAELQCKAWTICISTAMS